MSPPTHPHSHFAARKIASRAGVFVCTVTKRKSKIHIISQETPSTAALLEIGMKWASVHMEGGGRIYMHTSYSWDSAEGVRRHFLCLNKAPAKGRHRRLSPAADCWGDRMAPRGALMPLVIICDTQLSLSPSPSLRSRANSSRNIPGSSGGMSLSPNPVEQVNDVVITQLCWSLIGLKSPTCKWSFISEVKNADPRAPSMFLKGKCLPSQSFWKTVPFLRAHFYLWSFGLPPGLPQF